MLSIQLGLSPFSFECLTGFATQGPIEVGFGASATVYHAIYIPLNELVAVKCLDLDRINSNLDSVIKILDAFYRDRHYARFFVLETIARVPYFAFISVPHLYESFCWWRRADYLN
ncbi:hypothetical protein K1719_040304 [Acacia pycnantha]|nr:hypothetical protein K1719_040304 [Acacia pycnantha]